MVDASVVGFDAEITLTVEAYANTDVEVNMMI